VSPQSLVPFDRALTLDHRRHKKEYDFRSYAWKIPGFGAGPKYTRNDDFEMKQEFKKLQFFESVLALN
jgi:hypothetical protein